MKKIFSIIVLVSLYSHLLFSQVAINNDGSPPDASAGLDVNYLNKGVLIPRMTANQRTSISSPAPGLLVYQSDLPSGFWYYDGTGWELLTSKDGTSVTNYLTKWNSAGTLGNSLVFDNGTKVGIGTTSPGRTLDVNGTTRSRTLTGSGYGAGQFQSFAGIGQGLKAVYSFYPTFTNTPGDDGARRAADILSGFNGGNWGNEYLAFQVGRNGAVNDVDTLTIERMRITGNGNIGIGTSSPQRTLHINGEPGVAMRISASGSGQSLELMNSNSGADWRINNNDILVFLRSTDNFATTTSIAELSQYNFLPGIDSYEDIGSSTRRWRFVYALALFSSSDARLKKNILDLEPAMPIVRKLRSVSYQWKDDSIDMDRTHLGFIAQDLMEVLPQVVVDHEWVENPQTGKREWVLTDRLGVAYNEIIPVLVKAIQEQQVMIEELKEENRKIRDALVR